MTRAYILGVLHDGTVRRLTYRIVSKNQEYIEFLAKGIQGLGQKAWIYREGKNRQLYVVEFSKNFLKNFTIKTKQDKIAYIRGYFDAEGGVPQKTNARYYLYFAQKNLKDLQQVRQYLLELGIQCGRLHNPSKNVAPDYWRFFISCKSYELFGQLINSWHPVKSLFIRMKI